MKTTDDWQGRFFRCSACDADLALPIFHPQAVTREQDRYQAARTEP
jgi:hypothetical protein